MRSPSKKTYRSHFSRFAFFSFLSCALVFTLANATIAFAAAGGVCKNKRSDINGDGSVNVIDFSLLSATFFKSPVIRPGADINQDGRVDLLDFTILQDDFLTSCPQTPTPAPSVAPSPAASVAPSPVPSPPQTTGGHDCDGSGNIFTSNSDGDVFRGGVPCFPFGYYHVSDVGNRYGAALKDDVADMAKNGFNVIQMPITGPNGLPSTADARKVALDNNMLVIASYYKPRLSEWLAASKLDKTIMAWNTADDFNFPYDDPKSPPSTVKTNNDTLQSLANAIGYKTYTYGSGGGYPYATGVKPHLFGAYKDTNMDFMGVQVYPIENNDGSFAGTPLEESLAYHRYVRAQAPNKPIFSNMQTFAWSNGGPCKRWPTPQETKNMLYGALAEGMNGIVAYAYHEECGLIQQPKLSEDSGDVDGDGDKDGYRPQQVEMNTLRKEVAGDFLQTIMSGKRTIRDTAAMTAKLPGRIHATFWETTTSSGAKRAYVVVLNTHQTAPLTATPTINAIEVPGDWSSPVLLPQFSDANRYPRSMSLTQSNGKWYLTGGIEKQGVQVYRIEQ